MRRRPLVVIPLTVLALALLTLVACDGGGSLPEPASAGAQLFTANCARCHGADAGGMSGAGPSLRGGKPAAEVEDKIRNGVDNRMPSFEKDLSEAEIATLTEYVSTLPSEGDDSGG